MRYNKCSYTHTARILFGAEKTHYMRDLLPRDLLVVLRRNARTYDMLAATVVVENAPPATRELNVVFFPRFLV